MVQFEEVLEFWFGKPDSEDYGQPRQVWFRKNKEFDEEVKSRFLSIYQQAVEGQLQHWEETAEGCLALIIVFDQLPRNMFRNKPEAFASDYLALKYANKAIEQNFDSSLLPIQRWFIYIPFEHSENLEDQRTCVQLFSSLEHHPESANTIDYARRHLEVIERFGRFPHRNIILGRESTQEELEFLQQPGSSF